MARRGADRQPQVFDLLEYAIRNRERVVSKDDLLAAVWNGRIVLESTLSTRINVARNAIGDSDGMRVDLYDDRGIQQRDIDPTHEFEAGWTEAGAVCVHHVRVKENISPERLAASCPRLRDRLGATCTEERARGLGATLFVRSLP
jgi:hypothetical protein